nr:uncharacterized protein LOC127486659 [Oryctolagus cuniculus]
MRSPRAWPGRAPRPLPADPPALCPPRPPLHTEFHHNFSKCNIFMLQRPHCQRPWGVGRWTRQAARRCVPWRHGGRPWGVRLRPALCPGSGPLCPGSGPLWPGAQVGVLAGPVRCCRRARASCREPSWTLPAEPAGDPAPPGSGRAQRGCGPRLPRRFPGAVLFFGPSWKQRPSRAPVPPADRAPLAVHLLLSHPQMEVCSSSVPAQKPVQVLRSRPRCCWRSLSETQCLRGQA